MIGKQSNQIPVCEGNNIAETIYEQLKATSPAPWSIFGILGVKNLVKSEDSLTMKLAGVQQINTVVIKYDEGQDLYNIQFWNCRVLNREPYIVNKMISESKGVFCDEMSELIIKEVQS